MSEFRFRLPKIWKLNSYQLSLIHVVGIDGIPTPCKVRVSRDGSEETRSIVHIARNQSDSGHVYFLFPHRERGEILLSTGTLPVVDQLYDLLKELARGTLNRLRNQISIWEEGGLEIAEEIRVRLTRATRLLSQSIMAADEECQDALAAEAIELGVDLIFKVSQNFGEQIGTYRSQQPDFPNFWLAADLGTDGAETGQKIFFPPRSGNDKSNQIDWIDFVRKGVPFGAEDFSDIRDSGNKRVIVGPWIDASSGGWSPRAIENRDHLDRRKTILGSLRKGLEQLTDQVAILHLIGGLNGIGHRHLSYPQQIQLATDMLQLADEALVEVPIMVSFDFPWGERLASAVGGIHPIQIADTLLRHGSRVSYLGLEINLDYWPGGSVIRDPFQWIDLIDNWAQLDIPLVICLRAPFGGVPISPDQPIDRMVNQQRSNVNDDQRMELLNVVLSLLMARPNVHGLIWSQCHDHDDSRFPFGGYWTDQNGPKLNESLMQSFARRFRTPQLLD